KGHFSSGCTSAVSGGRSHGLVVQPLGVAAGEAGAAGDGGGAGARRAWGGPAPRGRAPGGGPPGGPGGGRRAGGGPPPGGGGAGGPGRAGGAATRSVGLLAISIGRASRATFREGF